MKIKLNSAANAEHEYYKKYLRRRSVNVI